MTLDSVDARCCDCGSAFSYVDSHFRSKRLAPPRRCPGCRLERRSRRVTVRGVVYRLGKHFGLARDDEHEVFFAPDLRADSGLRPGDPITWEVDPAQRPGPGRCPTAYSVRRA